LNVVPFILRRLGFGVFVLFGILVITFILAHSIPGNPVQATIGELAGYNPVVTAKLEAAYHYNDPIYIQFYYYLVNLAHGNLGYSTSRGMIPVATVIEQTFPFTLQLAVTAVIITLPLGIFLGVLASRFAHGPVDKGIRAFYLAGVSSPAFFIALIFLIVFTYYLRIFPSGGAVSEGIAAPSVITGFPIIDSLLTGNWTYFDSAVYHLILPSLALAAGAFGVIVRILRTSMLNTLQSNYIQAARARGLDERTVFFKHGLRNALIPVVSISSLLVHSLIAGTLFVENIFAYPGMGQYVFQALMGQDYPGILATAIIYAMIIIVGNLIVDILYVVVDPQITLG
jgi:peptide/nickel transport system permease protein